MSSSEVALNREDLQYYYGDITPDDIDSLDTEKLSEALLKSLYAVNSALFANANNEVNRLKRFKGALDHIENELTDPDYINSLEDSDRLKLYQIIQNNSTKSSDYLLKLSTSMAAGLDSISKIKAVKSTMDNSPIEIPQSNEERKLLLSDVQEELKRRQKAGEK